MLNREAILSAQDTKAEEVAVPEWGGTVRVRMMTGRERDEFEREQYEIARMGQLGDNMRARLLVRCLVDAENRPLFTADDVQALGEKSSAALERVARVARRLNKLQDDDVSDTAKNSEPSRAESST